MSSGYVAIVDAVDAERVLASKWSPKRDSRTVYAQRNVRLADGRRTTQSMHAFLTGYARTDHRNGDGLDNRRINLRDATAGENSRNTRVHADSASGFKGVTWYPRSRRWRAHIHSGKKQHHLGYFATADEAARAYDAAARELYGEFACLNFPDAGERAA